MKKRAVLIVIISLVLVVSVGVNSYLVEQNVALIKENGMQTSRLEMVSALSQMQVAVDAQLHRIGCSVVYASQQLSGVGLEGEQAREVLSALAANSSFIIDAATADLNNNLVTIEPSAYRSSEGLYIGEQDYMNTHSRSPIRPTLTDVMPLVEGFSGSIIVAPIFSSNGSLIGSVSVIFDPAVLLNATIMPFLRDDSYAITVSQLDSKIIYDTDPAQQGKSLTDPVYENYPELLSFAHRVAEESSGYGTYSYSLNAGSSQVVHKECYWTTISAYGQEWRLALIHALDA